MKIKEPSFRFGHVMLIDDSELDNFINEKTLEANHFAKKAYIHTSAKSALEFLSNLLALGDDYSRILPQVIFIDINMPMMDGFQFIEQLRKLDIKKLNDPKLVILTSSLYQEDRQKAMELGKDIVFLNKPLTKELLEKIIP